MKRIIISLCLGVFLLLPSFVAHAATGVAVSDIMGTITSSTANVLADYTRQAAGTEETKGLKILYGKNETTYATENSKTAGPSTIPVGGEGEVTFSLTALSPSTTYYYDIVDQNVSVVEVYATGSFTTTEGSATEVAGTTSPLDEIKCDSEDGYCLLAPLPISGTSETTTKVDTGASDGPGGSSFDFGDYVNGIFMFAIGLAGVLAVIMIVIGGIQYMSTDNFSEKAEGRGRIWNAVLGLVLLLGSYMLLNTLNPNLVKFTFVVKEQALEADGVITFSDIEYLAITGVSNPLPAEIDAAVASAAGASSGTEYCKLKALVERESGSKANAIGHDENVSWTSWYSSYKASAKTYKGVSFAGKDVPKNDDNVPCASPGLCLDWRYSHGIGLMQVTFFPNPEKTSYKTDSRTLYKSPQDLLVLTTNITAGKGIFDSFLTFCGGNLHNAYGAYNSGSCGSGGNGYAEKAMESYNACMAGG